MGVNMFRRTRSALELHDLPDLVPAKIHMTVPPNFRREIAVPKILSLHKQVLKPSMRAGDVAYTHELN